MGVLNTSARSCLLDCQIAVEHLKKANEKRVGKSDFSVYRDKEFARRIESAERAFRRAKESLLELEELPRHSRALRVCKKACDSCREVLLMIDSRQKASKVRASLAKLLRHCQRSLV